MNLFAGKSVNERNKMIAAMVLGFVALVALYLAFGRGIFSGSTPSAASSSPTPKPAVSSSNPNAVKIPSGDATTDVVYRPGDYPAPDPGRNIFAFYEPPPPCPTCPTPPAPVKQTPPPTPSPTPPMRLEFVTPQTLYAGSAAFRLEANGDRFDASAKIYFRKSEMDTHFVSEKKLYANVPAMNIAIEGPADVIVQTPDGKKYSEQVIVNIQPPPKPTFKFIGMIARARHNNDTAYFSDGTQGSMPTAARLNDVVGGRFRLISISSAETIFEDVNLGFKHHLRLENPPPGTGPNTGGAFRGGFQNNGDNNFQINQNPNMQNIPGIPNNIPRVNAPQNANRGVPQKKNEEDDDGDGKPDRP
jgi:hypothetical protein